MLPLPVKTSWDFEGDVAFPDLPFVVRGDRSEEIFSWSPRLKAKWNDGQPRDIEEFLSSEKSFNRVKTDGKAVGFPGSTTHSFELPTTDVTLQVHPSVKVMSAASIAAIGDWCTLGHIEWGGGESIAKHNSGRKLWIFANKSHGKTLFDIANFEDLHDFLTKKEARRSSGKKLEKHIFYHLSVPGDVIVQPSFAVHAVFTQASQLKGRPVWACVTGYEALDPRFDNGHRGMRVLNEFALGIRRNEILKELKTKTHYEVLRLLRIRDYRRAAEKAAANDNPLPNEIVETDVTTHVKVLYLACYDLKQCVVSRQSNRGRKKGRAGNLPIARRTGASVLWEVTDLERRQWPVLVLQELEKVS